MSLKGRTRTSWRFLSHPLASLLVGTSSGDLMSNEKKESPFGPQHPQYVAMVYQPLSGGDEEGEAPRLQRVQGFDIAYGTDEEPAVGFIAATEVRRDFNGTMLLFVYEDIANGPWIACDAILWMRPATREVDMTMRQGAFRQRSSDVAAGAQEASGG